RRLTIFCLFVSLSVRHPDLYSFPTRRSSDLGKGPFDGAQQVAIKESVEVAGQAALNADFGGATIPGFAGAAYDLLKRKRVGIGGLRSAAKAAKTASDEADIGEVDVAIDDVGDGFTNGLRAQIIRDGYQSFEVSAFDLCQAQALLEGELFALQNRLKRIARAGGALGKSSRKASLRHRF